MKNKDRKWVVTAALALVLVLVMIATPFSGAVSAKAPEKSAPTAKAPPYGGTFKIGFQSDLKGLNPCVVNDVWSWNVIGFVYDTLGGTDKQTEEPIPWTAESWAPDSEDDPLNWTVHIRQNVKWHDGQPLTADDVVFSYNFLHDVGRYVSSLESLDWTPLPGATDMNETYFVGVKKVDTYTVHFQLWRTNPTFLLDVMGIPLLPKHIWRNHWNDKTTWNMDWDPNTGTANVIGSGPFKFKYWKQGVEAKIERNPDYFWESTLEDGNTYKVPFVDAIQFIIYKNMDAMVTALKQGMIDYIWWSIDPGWIPQVSQIPGVKVFVNDDRGYYYLMFNMMLPFEGYDTGTGYQPRSDENDQITYPNPQAGDDAGLPFRKAVSYCIDKEYIVTRLLQGYGTKGDSIVPPSYSIWYNASLPQYAYSIDTAKSILDSANYKDVNGDGWREDYKGRTMDGPNNNGKIDILTPPADYDPIRAEAGKKIAEGMKAAGINAESVPTSFGQIVDAVFASRNYEMFILGWRLSLDPSWVYDFFNSKYDWYNPGIGDGGNNAAGYRNQYYDSISSQVMSEMDAMTRISLVKECQGIIAQHLPTNVLYYRKVIEAADNDEWVGYSPRPGGIGNGWTLMEIHHPLVPKPHVEINAYPAVIPGKVNESLTLTATAYHADNTPYPNVKVQISFSPALDSEYFEVVGGTQQFTNANGNAYFVVKCKKDVTLDTLYQVTAIAPDLTDCRNGSTAFTVTMGGLSVEATSPKIVEGIKDNKFYLNVTVKNNNQPLPNAQVEIQTLNPPENLKILTTRANTDASGTVSLDLSVTADFTASASVEIKYTVWPAGGAKTLYSKQFLVLAKGGSEVEVAVDTIGAFNGTSGFTQSVGVTVTQAGSPLPGAAVYGYVIPSAMGVSVVEESQTTDTSGKATFTLKVDTPTQFTASRTFKFVAVVANANLGGYGEEPFRVVAPGTGEISVLLSLAQSEIRGYAGAQVSATVTVLSGTAPAPNADVSLILEPSTGLSAETGKKTDNDGKAVVNITLTQNFASDVQVSVKAQAKVLDTTAESLPVTLVVKVPFSVSISLEKSEIEGKKDNTVNATVTVMNGTAPMQDVNVGLTLNPSTNIQVTPASATTNAEGKATFTITLTADFTERTTVSLEAKATISGLEYKGSAQLTVVPPSYEVTMTLEKTEIEGKKDNTVNATITVKQGGVGVANLPVTLSLDPATGLSANSATTDENGTAVVTITITQDFTNDTSVKVTPKVNGTDYPEKAVNLTVKAKTVGPSYEVTMTLEKTEIEGSKDTTVKATITVKQGGVGVPNITVTVSFDKSGLSATQATTDQDGKAEVTITLTQDFTSDTTVKVTPKVAGTDYSDQAKDLKIKAKAETTTPGFEFVAVIAAIALVAGLLTYARRKQH